MCIMHIYHNERLHKTSLRVQVFMEELNRKFPEVENATKSCKRKSVPKQQISPSKRLFTSMPST